MRLLLVGAFPYPHHQGSQVYFKEQAIALRSAGVEVSLLTYASTRPGENNNKIGLDGNSASEHWRALDGFAHRMSPKWTSPSSLRSGPNWAKPLGDLGLAMTLRDAIASCSRHDAYDAILTHNAEAALIALHALPRPRPPILYCLHTLLGNELSAYFNWPKLQSIFYSSGIVTRPSGATARSLDRFGGGIDRWIAERVDGWLSLTHSSARVMRQFTRVPGSLVPPPVPDPEQSLEPLDPTAAAFRHSLQPGRFFLYSGNLDAYQELDLLTAAAARLAERSDDPPQIVIASHNGNEGLHGRSPGTTDSAAKNGHPQVVRRAGSMPGVEFRKVESASEMQALLAAARASLVMRRAEGGFPIKIVNSLAVGTPVIAFQEREWGLAHERNSLICDSGQGVLALADAIERLAVDDALAKRLSAGARALYLERHLPEQVASETLALVQKIGAFQPR